MFEVSHLAKRYYKNQVLKDVSFTAAPGECIGLIGPNGCGKSTLLQIVSGMLKQDQGTICFDGEELTKKSGRFSQLIGYVPQANPLFDDMTVYDHLALWYSSSPYSLEQDLTDGFPARLGIVSFLDKKVCELSGGMKKRLSLACSLANRPPLVFLDEPAAALDLVCKEEIRSYVRELKEEGKTILLATHEEADFDLCSRLLLFHDKTLTELPPDTPIEEIVRRIESR
ncbi:MAG: ATP-binding cassette domain-containing protein [Lachnospiraceae bacterium]|nr:ATP-binding cassette domain-containing protein [Lachnospiraceae bacterium]